MTKSQKMLIEDGLPPELLLSSEQRRMLWEQHPPRAVLPSQAGMRVRNQDPETIKALAEVQEQNRSILARGLRSKNNG